MVFSVHNQDFCGGPNTSSQEKTSVFIVINTITCVPRVTNRVEVHCLNSQHLAMVRKSNMAELVPSGIFCLQPWFLQQTEQISLRKTPVFMSSQVRSIKNCLSVKIIPRLTTKHKLFSS